MLKLISKVWLLMLLFTSTGLSLASMERIFVATPFFQPLGDELDEVPASGYAIGIELATIQNDLLRELNIYYRDGKEESRWYFFYLADGRLHKKVQINDAEKELYEEQLIYRYNKQLWMVLSNTRSYTFRPKATFWQEAGVLKKVRVMGANASIASGVENLRPLFVIDATASRQIEEIWVDGKLQEMRFYSYGMLQQIRFPTSKDNFEDIFYYNDQAILKRKVVDGQVVNEEVLEPVAIIKDELDSFMERGDEADSVGDEEASDL